MPELVSWPFSSWKEFPDVDSLMSKRFDSLFSKCVIFQHFVEVIRWSHILFYFKKKTLKLVGDHLTTLGRREEGVGWGHGPLPPNFLKKKKIKVGKNNNLKN
jgi:hypothetical protein